MQFSIGDRILKFVPVPLRFETSLKADVFAQKNNKTVGETLSHPKYRALERTLFASYSACSERKLGEFLLELKMAGDGFYKRFLNAYGDTFYCRFLIEDADVSRRMGLYCFVVDGRVKYIGRSTDSFKKRINQGYGTIHPKNCYRDGQATNCHLNSLIAKCQERVSFLVCPMDTEIEIKLFEEAMIRRENNPEWNIQLKQLSSPE